MRSSDPDQHPYIWLAGTKSQDRSGYLPPQEEHPVLRDISEVKLQFRETLPVAGQETCRVCSAWITSPGAD